MPKYNISFKHEEYGQVEIEAKNLTEAEELAWKELDDGNVFWGNDDTEILEVEKVKS